MKSKILNICIIGNTNSGKSTFLNSIIGKEISISNKKRNTTIDSVVGIINNRNLQMIFNDTPGMIFENTFKISIPSIQSLDHSPFCHISDCFSFQFLALLVFVEP